MPELHDLYPGEDAEDHLWRHRINIDEAYSVLDQRRFKVFADPGHADRALIIGPSRTGRLLTLVVQRPDHDGVATLITGWPSDEHERTVYSRPGGSTHG